MTRHLLFVYGTLKRGYRSHHLLDGQEFVGNASTAPGYRLYDSGDYPCLVKDTATDHSIHGELFRVDEACLARLDEYEGAPHLFMRTFIEVPGVHEPVFTYLYVRSVSGFRDCGTSWPTTARPTNAE